MVCTTPHILQCLNPVHRIACFSPSVVGLNDMNGRIQDALAGRFLSPDPYVSQPDNTQNYNRYKYVNNNPMTYTDPSW
jgi:RHS repeat-associated protein